MSEEPTRPDSVGAGEGPLAGLLVADFSRVLAGPYASMLLADMGVETDELYTADVTRTMPVSGKWTPEQLKVYRAVLEAQAAGIAEVKAGADFYAPHRAAMYVLADHLHSWGLLPVTAEVYVLPFGEPGVVELLIALNPAGVNDFSTKSLLFVVATLPS